MRRLWRFTGLIAAAMAWATISLSISRNPWFSLYRHALSDLGGPGAIDPWVYNVGLIATGVVASTYAIYLASAATEKFTVYASSFIFIAGIFLALIGVFPSSTRPHVFVSTWFFVQMWMAVLASAIGSFAKRELAFGAFLLGISFLGPAGALTIGWPSVALLEIYGIVLIDAYIAVLTWKY